jgi:hypothetical protein
MVHMLLLLLLSHLSSVMVVLQRRTKTQEFVSRSIANSLPHFEASNRNA